MSSALLSLQFYHEVKVFNLSRKMVKRSPTCTSLKGGKALDREHSELDNL